MKMALKSMYHENPENKIKCQTKCKVSENPEKQIE